CRDGLEDQVDSAVFPYTQGGPLMHQIAGKTVALGQAQQQDFHSYQRQIRNNAEALGERLQEHGFRLVSGGTDNHLVLVDVGDSGMTGKEAETRLEQAGIIVNKNMIPYDPQSPKTTSGIRIGTPALTTRGMEEQEFQRIADLIARVLLQDETRTVREEVDRLCQDFPLYRDAAITY
ncbi:MAG: serine hydroxymethyltransferase, partial [Candidatus Nanohaloarchaea archaeon]|nr:serine hydroxymethyltransferase [Candidatus Nanohaloarchaea archaeon]